ncbi:AAA family ATPase [Chryseobacterium sp. LJ756]|nr:AAA family ATPase [Chryseobacterium sp. LJ756]
MNTSDEFLEIVDLLEYKKQIILKGPPGTGKTRMSEEISRYIIGNQINFETDEKFELTIDLIKKHIYVGLKISSKSGIEYFIEEINSGNIGVKSANSKIWYPSFNQIIKSYNNKLYKEKNRSTGFKSYEDAVALYLESIIPNDTLLKINPSEINLEVSPYYKIVQFHPSFNYEDFVRGIVSKPNEKGDGIIYEGENKILAEYANVAFDNPKKKYVLVIDEINRANLSSVLGELIYALEYRDKSIESMYKVDQDNSFVLPSNLYIIGTMNTADRSVNHIDYAIKRRFAFVDVLPKPIEEENTIFHNILFEQVAKIFQEHLSEEFSINDLQLGQSYFIDKSKEKGSMKIRLKYEIKPILKEYVQDGILKESALDEINQLSVV